MSEFPPLKRSDRSREFNQFDDYQRACVVYSWLFTQMGFRDIDEVCLGEDRQKTRGYRSMGIAHYLGLIDTHKGYFEGASISFALSMLLDLSSKDPGYGLIYCYLRDWALSHYSKEIEDREIVREMDPVYHTDRNEAVYWITQELLPLSTDHRIDDGILLLQNANPKTQSVKIQNKIKYYSKASLREAVKCLYDYHCQICKTRIYSPGWISSLPRRQQWRYLNADAHHIKPISQDGPDTIDNLLCLCPTCHRRFHTNELILLQRGERLGCENVVLKQQWPITTKHRIVLRS